MLYEIVGREFEFDCKLGVTVRIKAKLRKSYNQIISELDKLDVDDMIKLLYCGISKDEIEEEAFKQFLYDNAGMGDLTDAVTWFIKQIQYPGLTDDEIEKKLEEKRLQAKKFQD